MEKACFRTKVFHFAKFFIFQLKLSNPAVTARTDRVKQKNAIIERQHSGTAKRKGEWCVTIIFIERITGTG